MFIPLYIVRCGVFTHVVENFLEVSVWMFRLHSGEMPYAVLRGVALTFITFTAVVYILRSGVDHRTPTKLILNVGLSVFLVCILR